MESRLSHSVVSFEQLVRDGVLSPIHQSFGDLIRRLDPDGHPDVPLAAALTSDQLSRGHTCLELDAIDQLSLLPNESDLRDSRYGDWPAVSNWLAVLNSSPLVSSATDAARQINANTYRVMEAWLTASLLYLATCYLIAIALRQIEKRYSVIK